MKKLILCAAIAATVMGALPASAQVVVRERGDAVVVRTGDRDGFRHRRHHDCRVVKVRTRLGNGTVIVKTRRMC
jgi:hypothetical protein